MSRFKIENVNIEVDTDREEIIFTKWAPFGIPEDELKKLRMIDNEFICKFEEGK